MEPKKNIFVLGLDSFNLKHIQKMPDAHLYHFHQLLNPNEIVHSPTFDIEALLAKARKQLNEFDGSIDAIIGYWDFPTVLLMPILRRDYNLPGPSLESVLKCEHKYWSRLEQNKVIPDHIPNFKLIDPFDKSMYTNEHFNFPLWIKPIKAHSSLLGFRVNHQKELLSYINHLKSEILRFSQPLHLIMEHAHIPHEITSDQNGLLLLEEMIIADHQCTLEGYVFDDDIHIYGIVDSIRGHNGSSFERYEYPSSMPKNITDQMKLIAKKAIAQTKLNYSPFNIEFFYNASNNQITLLEINARISISHSRLFEKVDGISHEKIMVDIALGKEPTFEKKSGHYQCAAKFMPRVYGDECQSIITNIANHEEIKLIENQFKDTDIMLHVHKGDKITDSKEHDSYSYLLATIFMCDHSHHALLDKYQSCLKALNIRWEPHYDTQARHN